MNLLQMSFAGAIMIIAIVVIRALAINKLPKKTFLVLWGIVLLRLLIPFSMPSTFSAYSLLGNNIPAKQISTKEIPNNQIPTAQTSVEGISVKQISDQKIFNGQPTDQLPADKIAALPSTLTHSITTVLSPVWTIIWGVGFLVCALFFAISYIKCCQEFQVSLPVDGITDFAGRWLNKHQLHRNITIRQSHRVTAPLTYGIFKPIILMPITTDWNNETALEYVLAHEYIHIRRFDGIAKLIMITALCFHWFNPLVWVMYILFNRDIELSCDEAVVRLYGENTKSSYALTLISMEETRSSLTPLPLCNSFSKNAIEERITAIMKIKKTSFLAILAAVLVVIGVTAAFATSAATKQKKLEAISNTVFTDEDYEKLSALQFNGYEEMTISEFQSKVWKVIDTDEYQDLLERFSQNSTVYQLKSSHETASFYVFAIESLTAEDWKKRDFLGYLTMDDRDSSKGVLFQYHFTFHIQDEDTLTVGEYNQAGWNLDNELQSILQELAVEALQDEGTKSPDLSQIEQLEQRYSSDLLQLNIEVTYTPTYGSPENTETASEYKREKRQYPNANVEDYQSLLALKTAYYQKMSVTDFNKALLDWGNSDNDRFQRIQEDIFLNDIQVGLSKKEFDFVKLTIRLSNEENALMIHSLDTGVPEKDPSCGYMQGYIKNPNDYLILDQANSAWYFMTYEATYHIADKSNLTVGERDQCINGFLEAIDTFWGETSFEELIDLANDDMVSYLEDLATEYSNDQITITLHKDKVLIHSKDERHLQ